MQPTLTHVPPNTPCSTMAMRQSSKSGVTSELPEPVPTMTRSNTSTGLNLDAAHRLGHQIAEQQVQFRRLEAVRGEPSTDIDAVALEVVRTLRVRDHIDDLRQVDEHEPALVDEHVVGRQVAVRVAGLGENAHGIDALLEQAGDL